MHESFYAALTVANLHWLACCGASSSRPSCPRSVLAPVPYDEARLPTGRDILGFTSPVADDDLIDREVALGVIQDGPMA